MPYTNDFFRRAGACSRRHFIRTVGDDCPYSKKTSVYQLSYQKALRARRVNQTVRWTVCSQSGEQFIIATGGFKSGTQSQVSQRLSCFFFLRLKKEVTHLFFACVMRFTVRSGRNAYYIFEHAAEIIHVVIAHHSRNFAYRNIAVRKQFRGSLHS